MRSTIEANSLTSITETAAHPPRYPRNPTEQKRPPLVLYIARVPGSQDVILTTMKPGLKNLTAEDVASSLYYLHRDNHNSDASFFDDAAVGIGAEHPSPNKPERPLIARKPVGSDIRRKPVGSTSSDLLGAINVDIDSSRQFSPGDETKPVDDIRAMARRPLGPRPMSSQHVGQDIMPLTEGISGKENLPTTVKEQAVDDETLTLPPRLPPRPTVRVDAKQSGSSQREAHIRFNGPLDFAAEPYPISITLIRRDPTSGAQWNIGKLNGHTISSLDPPSVSETSSVLTSIHLTTPGYSPFYDPPSAHPLKTENVTSQDITPRFQPRPGFIRQVLTEWSGPWDRSFKTRRRGSSDPGIFRYPPVAADDPMGGDYSKSSKSRLRAYVFQSPWNGRCELTTGNGGRVLKCKHTLPDNAAVPNSQHAYSGPGVTVSELRFNLPTSSLFKGTLTSSTTTDSGRPRRPTLTHIRNKLSGESSRPVSTTPHPTSYAAMYPSEEEDDNSDEYEDDRYGLSLGQEKAGGGNRGKRAKLGKLIIYEEGYKMLDLIVAANMGIWWSIWEKE